MTWHIVTWHDMTWHDMTWHNTRYVFVLFNALNSSGYALLCYVKVSYVMLCDVMLLYVLLCHVKLCYVMLCDGVLRYVRWCCVMTCSVLLWVCVALLHLRRVVSLFRAFVFDQNSTLQFVMCCDLQSLVSLVCLVSCGLHTKIIHNQLFAE